MAAAFSESVPNRMSERCAGAGPALDGQVVEPPRSRGSIRLSGRAALRAAREAGPSRRRPGDDARGSGTISVKRGRFIVVEGAEGVGKTTQVGQLRLFLEAAGKRVAVTREPGGTAVGERIRELLLHERGARIAPRTELLLMLAARAALVREVVRPALAAGRWVLSDRYDLSSVAYQGHGRGIDPERVAALNAFATGDLKPDLCLVIDLPAEEGLARQRRSARPLDRFESESASFRERVRRGYLEMVRSGGGAVLVAGGGSVEEVRERMIARVRERWPSLEGSAMRRRGRQP